jgi:hypothetical protein
VRIVTLVESLGARSSAANTFTGAALFGPEATRDPIAWTASPHDLRRAVMRCIYSKGDF